MEEQTVQEMDEYVALFRGMFLNRMTYIERAMELVIASHFCTEEKQVEFIDSLLGEKYISFEAKRVAFNRFLEAHHKEYFENKKDILKKLKCAQEDRNKIAHYMMCLTTEALEKFKKDKTFGLVQYYERGEPVWFDVATQTKVSQAMDELHAWFKIATNDEQ